MPAGISKLRNVHSPQDCAGEFCCIHNPSDHHMVDWPQHWRGDRGMMERLCLHGIGHPDPDHLSYVQRRFEAGVHPWGRDVESIHGCDGCCSASSPDGAV